ncbi:Uncharacterised protein [Bordetella pertussis]|nr:Uncharacterised protein [Bordetella pertussis]
MSGSCRPASSGTTSHRRKPSWPPVSRSMETRMSASSLKRFFIAEASALSSAPNTTSRVTFFSRAKASTNRRISRLIAFCP